MRLDGSISEQSDAGGHAWVSTAQSFQCRVDEVVIELGGTIMQVEEVESVWVLVREGISLEEGFGGKEG